MDSGARDANSSVNGNGSGRKPFSVEKSKGEAEEVEGETKTLLLQAAKTKVAVNGGRGGGGIAKKKSQEKSRRRVQWNDRNGRKLFEVLEFQPSDSSDSEEDESISGEWIWKYAIAGCINIFCCRGDKILTHRKHQWKKD